MRYRTKAGVEVSASSVVIGNEMVFVLNYNAGSANYTNSLFKDEFEKFFEPIEDKPAEPDSVTVKRVALEIALGDAEEVAAANPHRSVLADCCVELRAALGEKACEHKTARWNQSGPLTNQECIECGMVRTMGEWKAVEQK